MAIPFSVMATLLVCLELSANNRSRFWLELQGFFQIIPCQFVGWLLLQSGRRIGDTAKWINDVTELLGISRGIISARRQAVGGDAGLLPVRW